MALKAIDDTVLEVEDFRELDESVLAAMGEKELSAHASLAYRADASTRYMDLVYSHVKDAAVEEKVMCYTDVGFEVSGGGVKNPELKKLNEQISHIGYLLEIGGFKIKTGDRRPLTDEEVSTNQVNGRRLTSKEKDLKELLVSKVFSCEERNAKVDELARLKEARESKKQEISEDRQKEVVAGIDEVKQLILNPLDGLLVNKQGQKRKYAELEALVLSRRKQEDLLLKNLREEELNETKRLIQKEKEEYDAKIASLKAGAEQAKEEAKASKSAADKAKAEEKAAEANAKKAEANAKEAEANAKEAEANAKKAEAKKKAEEAKLAAKALKASSKGKKEKKEKKDKSKSSDEQKD